MTLKQFIYLAVGCGMAYFVFALLSGPIPFLGYPLTLIFALTGVAFAFLPINERPLDQWVKAYFTAIFAPTQRKYVSKKFDPKNPDFDNRLQIYLSELPDGNLQVKASTTSGSLAQHAPLTQSVISTVLPDASNVAPETVDAIAQPAVQETVPTVPSVENTATNSTPAEPIMAPIAASTPPPQSNPPMPNSNDAPPLQQVVNYSNEAQNLAAKITEYQNQLADIKAKAAQSTGVTSRDMSNFQSIMQNLQQLSADASQVSQQLASTPTTASTSTAAASETNTTNAPKVVDAASQPTEKFVTLTTVPNLINGVVTDANGNYLVGAIVVAHDANGIPVRALKTNKLGQFLAATQLGDGTYTLSMEKDNLSFDQISITLDGSVLPPLKVVAQKGVQTING